MSAAISCAIIDFAASWFLAGRATMAPAKRGAKAKAKAEPADAESQVGMLAGGSSGTSQSSSRQARRRLRTQQWPALR